MSTNETGLTAYRNERLASAGRHLRRARMHREQAKRMGRRGCYDAAHYEVSLHERSMQNWRREVNEVLWADREIEQAKARSMVFD